VGISDQRPPRHDCLHVDPCQQLRSSARVLEGVNSVRIMHVAQAATEVWERTQLPCACAELTEVHGPFYVVAAVRP